MLTYLVCLATVHISFAAQRMALGGQEVVFIILILLWSIKKPSFFKSLTEKFYLQFRVVVKQLKILPPLPVALA